VPEPKGQPVGAGVGASDTKAGVPAKH
jgi:hypothetical protein